MLFMRSGQWNLCLEKADEVELELRRTRSIRCRGERFTGERA